MLFNFANVAVFLIFAVGFVLANLVLARILAPKASNVLKSIPYECGELPVGSPWIRFNPRYYIYALVFLIFEVEIAFIFPCAVIFRDWVGRNLGAVAFIEIFAFVSVLVMGLVYVWKRGDLAWIRTVAKKGM